MAASHVALLTLGVTATAAITRGQAVTPAGAVPSAAAEALGFAMNDAAIGDRVPVVALGTAIGIAGAAITAGALVEIGSTGRVVTKSAGVTVGRALTAAAAAGDEVEVLVVQNR